MRAFILTVCFVSFATSAWAQSADKPYSPKKMSPSQVIKPATYDQAPIQFDFPLLSTRRVVNYARLDFEQTYDVAYWDFIEFMERSYKERQPVTKLQNEAFSKGGKTSELLIYGTAVSGDKSTFTLGHPTTPFKLLVDVYSGADAKARVVVRNSVVSMLYSGVMPARAPFFPVGASPIPFRWN